MKHTGKKDGKSHATPQRSINDPRLFVIHPSSNRRKEEDERKGSIAQQLINKSRSLNRMMELGRSSLGKQTTGQHHNTRLHISSPHRPAQTKYEII